MIRLLASVTGPAEAEIVIAGGADLVDLKDPSLGALGAATPAVLAATLAAVGGRRPVSAVAGDLPMVPTVVLREVAARQAADYVKIGLFPASREVRLAVIEALRPLAQDTRLIAVLFADGDPDFDLLPHLAEVGFAGAMIDTLGKGSGRLTASLSPARLGEFVRLCRELGLMSGLAGSLEPPDVARLAVLRPDYLGFRGALTEGPRDGPVTLAAVQAIRALIPTEAAAVAETQASGTSDRIFVRDFDLALEIGAYGHERGRRQLVRFSVDAEIDPIAPHAQSIGAVYSYDVIIDAIRALAESGHTDLVETLALDLARTVLADARVREVTVRVEKLELGPRAVGVEITRRR